MRNTKRFYLLRGMVFCGEDGSRLGGRGSGRGDYYYVCSKKYRVDQGIPQCPTPQQYGPTLENYVWNEVYGILSNPATWWAQMERQRQGADGGKEAVLEALRRLDRKLQAVDTKETDLVGYRLSGDVSEEAFKRQGALLRAERTYLQEERARLQSQLDTLGQAGQVIEVLEALRDQIIARLDAATPEDKRWVLERLYTRVTVRTGQPPLIELGVPREIKSAIDYWDSS